MAIIEIAVEALGVIVRFLSGLVVDVVIEIGIRGPGYLICRSLKRDVDFRSTRVALAGLGFWLLLGTAAYFLFFHASEA